MATKNGPENASPHAMEKTPNTAHAQQIEAQQAGLLSQASHRYKADGHGKRIDGLHPEGLGVAEPQVGGHMLGQRHGHYGGEQGAHEHAQRAEQEHLPAMAAEFGVQGQGLGSVDERLPLRFEVTVGF